MELRGPDPSVRVRQIRLLGVDANAANAVSPRMPKGISPVTMQHKACEQETLKVFRLITGLVFGRLLRNQDYEEDQEENVKSPSLSEDVDHNNDLREHMVGILFSRSKLNHLQKLVSFISRSH